MSSPDLRVAGFRPADAEWKKKVAAYKACKAAKIPIPDELLRYFEFEDPGDKPGMEVNLGGEAVTPWDDDMEEGFRIDLTKLPEGVKILRVYNSY